jgi:hypothetical protein
MTAEERTQYLARVENDLAGVREMKIRLEILEKDLERLKEKLESK